MLDRGEEARRDADEAYARLREQSSTRWPDWHLAEISGLAGDHEDASNRLRIVCEWLEATEQLPLLETYLSFLGRSLCRLGRFDEAAPFAERARAIGETIGEGGDSVADDYLWRQVLARVHAHRGELAEAERLAREAVAGSERSDSLDDQCLALCDLAEVLAAAERPRRGGSRARAGARALPAEEEPRARDPGAPATRQPPPRRIAQTGPFGVARRGLSRLRQRSGMMLL